MSETFDVSELEGLYTERALVAESTARDTIPKGDYNLEVAKVTPMVASDDSPFPGRKFFNLQLTAKQGDKSVTLFQRVSPEIRRQVTVGGSLCYLKPTDADYDGSLPLDKPSKLWGQLENVFNRDGSMTIVQTIQAIQGSLVGAYVLEGYAEDTPGGSIEWPPRQCTKEDYDAWKVEMSRRGLIPRNYLSNFHQVKA